MLMNAFSGIAYALEASAPELMLFMLALFLGYSVVSDVSPSLHAPLMGLTNAISSIIILPAFSGLSAFMQKMPDAFFLKATGFLVLGILGINILGGLFITHRMLSLFQAKKEKDLSWLKPLSVAMAIAFASFFVSTPQHQPSVILCILSGAAFLLSFRSLSGLKKAGTAIPLAAFGLIAATLPFALPVWLSIGKIIALWLPFLIGGSVGIFCVSRVKMTALPQLMAVFHSLVGLAATMMAFMIISAPTLFVASVSKGMPLEVLGGALIGALTFSGSLVAFLKLQEVKLSLAFLPFSPFLLWIISLAGLGLFSGLFILFPVLPFLMAASLIALFLGILFVLPIGGADMPIVISLLNSFSGWAAVSLGFSLHNPLLMIVGTVVGASGWILSAVMCEGMNRSLMSVLLGGFGTTHAASSASSGQHQPVQTLSDADSAFMLSQARSVVVIPGYGMAVAQAHTALREMAALLKEKGVRVRYGLHPVAGRMPGHMNVLLAEAQIPYEDIGEYEDINPDLANTDVVFVIGANDITNPSAKDPKSPLYGMPVFDVSKAGHVLFVKRSLATGYSGIDNPLFYDPKTFMLFGDAKKICEGILKNL